MLARINNKFFLPFFACALLPFFYLIFYSHPSGDDYAYINIVRNTGFWATQKSFYLTWSGRYFSTVLMSLNPLLWTPHYFYGIYPLIAIGVIYTAFYLFIYGLLHPILEKKPLAYCSLAMTSLYLFIMPGLNEGVYWAGGIINHTLSILSFGLFFYLLNRYRNFSLKTISLIFVSKKNELVLFLLLAVVAILNIGLNESALFVWDIMILFFFIVSTYQNKKIDQTLFYIGVISFICSLVVLLCPGNSVRSGKFEDSHQVFYTLRLCFIKMFELFFKFLNFPLILWLFFNQKNIEALKTQLHPKLLQKNYLKYSTFGFVALMYLFCMPSYWGSGCIPPKRNLNILCFLEIIFFSYLFILLVLQKPKWWTWVELKISKANPKYLLAAFVVLFLGFYNLRVSLYEIVFKLGTYEQEYQTNMKIIEQGRGYDVVISPHKYEPKTVFFGDIEKDPTDWHNQSISEYFKLKSIRK